MDNRRGMMRTFLFENLRDLMVRNVFEKITIKQICDETGVIRATFYNYFDDKYDCLNAIVYQDLVENTAEYLHKKDITGMLKVMYETIEDNLDFYRVGYNVVGQNSFEDMIRANLAMNFKSYFEENRNENYLPVYSNEVLSAYYAECLAFNIKLFVFQKTRNVTVDQMCKMTVDLMKNSFVDFVEQE